MLWRHNESGVNERTFLEKLVCRWGAKLADGRCSVWKLWVYVMVGEKAMFCGKVQKDARQNPSTCQLDSATISHRQGTEHCMWRSRSEKINPPLIKTPVGYRPLSNGVRSMVAPQITEIYRGYPAWRVGPFWQDTIDIQGPCVDPCPIARCAACHRVRCVLYDVFNTLRPVRNRGHFTDDILDAFSWMKMNEFRLKFHWSLFLRVQLIIFHHWFR